MTLLIASIQPQTAKELSAFAKDAWRQNADAVEVRIDAFTESPSLVAKHLAMHRSRLWIITCRSEAEGGSYVGDTAQRVSALIEASRQTGAIVDFEWADWTRSANIRQKVLLAATNQEPDSPQLILSAHDLSGKPDNLGSEASEILKNTGTIAKLAYTADHITDSFSALDLLHKHRGSVIAVAMGEAGAWTRVLAKKLGAFGTYGALSRNTQTAPGQLAMDDMRNLYRWDAINSDTKVFGVAADPVSHSMSPIVFNHWFDQENINAIYLPLRVGANQGGIGGFLDECRKRPWLDLHGLSVTLPHKQEACRYLGIREDALANKVGAVNTISLTGGDFLGYNTDCDAAIDSLANALGSPQQELSGTTFDVFGTGGAARAIIAALRQIECPVTIYGRTDEKAAALAEEFSCKSNAWSQRTQRNGRIIVQCTRVGMEPELDASPLPADALQDCDLVFDIIYNPLQTKLLRDASRAKIKTLNGLDMFCRQAARQFEIWTGKSPNIADAKTVIEAHLTKPRGNQS